MSTRYERLLTLWNSLRKSMESMIGMRCTYTSESNTDLRPAPFAHIENTFAHIDIHLHTQKYICTHRNTFAHIAIHLHTQKHTQKYICTQRNTLAHREIHQHTQKYIWTHRNTGVLSISSFELTKEFIWRSTAGGWGATPVWKSLNLVVLFEITTATILFICIKVL